MERAVWEKGRKARRALSMQGQINELKLQVSTLEVMLRQLLEKQGENQSEWEAYFGGSSLSGQAKRL